MERYEEYKDSGVEWIGEIPVGWDVVRFGKAVSSSLGKMLTSQPSSDGSFLAPYLKAVNLQDTGFDLTDVAEMYFEPGEYRQYGISRGDLLVVEGGSVGLAHVWNGELSECYIQNALHRVRPNDNYDVGFLKYCLDLARYSGYINLVCNKATIAHYTKDKLSDTPLVKPSISEQQTIAVYLDDKAAEIDALVADCEREVELLQEYRKAVISEAVTKGLDPNAPMKDSGIEWIGEIPVGWDVCRGKRIFSETNIRSSTGTEELLTVSHITGVTPRRDKDVKMFMAETLEGYKVVAANDIAANTMWLWAGAIGVAPQEGVVSYSYSTFRQREMSYEAAFLDYLLRTPALVASYAAHSSGVSISRLRLYPDKFLSLSFPVPPRHEQRAIVAYLDEKTAAIDSIIADKRAMIDKLREYRKSLISEAVTGKFKVAGGSQHD